MSSAAAECEFSNTNAKWSGDFDQQAIIAQADSDWRRLAHATKLAIDPWSFAQILHQPKQLAIELGCELASLPCPKLRQRRSASGTILRLLQVE